ncbi:uncharacterized protein ACWYII_013847 [Salvelinus alpinus]
MSLDTGIHVLREGDAALLKHGADDNNQALSPCTTQPHTESLQRQQSGLISLHNTASYRHTHIVALLIKFNARVNATDKLMVSLPC